MEFPPPTAVRVIPHGEAKLCPLHFIPYDTASTLTPLRPVKQKESRDESLFDDRSKQQR